MTHTSQNVRGRLHLGFAYQLDSKHTSLALCEQQPPLQVIRAFSLPQGGALVHLHNLSGGVLGGDQLELSVEVGPHAYAQLTTTSATRVYRSHADAPMALQTNDIQVREGGLLEYLPDPLIPFAGARYQQLTHIDLAEDGGLFWWETVAPGREARGEIFDYNELHLGLSISVQGRPIAIERLKLEPAYRPLTSPARLGPYRYFCSFYICRAGLEPARWSSLERELQALAQTLTQPGETVWGVSNLVAHGLLIRGLSRQGRTLPPGLLACWRAAKLALYGQEALPPRKIY